MQDGVVHVYANKDCKKLRPLISVPYVIAEVFSQFDTEIKKVLLHLCLFSFNSKR